MKKKKKKMLKLDLIFQTVNQIDRCQKEKIGLMKDELGRKIMAKFV